MELPLVSIIITTKNEEKNIGNCLKSILRQSYPRDKMEIIVVDNNSADRTKGIAWQCTDKVFNKGPERSAQRNFGVRQAQGKYYLYLDADMILNKNVIKEAVEKLEKNQDIVALYIPEVVIGNGFWCKARRFERSFCNATVLDCVRFIKIKNFLAVDGFDETMAGPEDWDFDKKIRTRGKVDIIKSVVYHNEREFQLIPYLKKKRYYIQSFDKYIAKWGKNDPDIRKQLSFYYRCFGVFVEKGKWKRLIKYPILTLEMLLLRFLVGFTYLINKKKKKMDRKQWSQ